ncbi:MAG TPA: BlaI/MecI/CopY family transcriptional regulator [Propionibacteriaceae bacterium]
MRHSNDVAGREPERKAVWVVRQLGQLEAVVMQRLWAADQPASVRDVVEDLRREREIAYTTVLTVLDNLRRKEMVSRTKDGRAYRYRPRLTREEHTASLMEEVLAGSENRQVTLLHFVAQMSPEEVARLRDALDAAASDAQRAQ